ncbi:MAG: V-type ATP synthase subunit D [Planctomycetes bacterium]|nr:V-type ATP synthase subunit D [Planctomycetota bacterium]
MAKKIKLTRPELKRQRDALARFERYLPMLKLKQQQLQMTLRQVTVRLRKAADAARAARDAFDAYRAVLADRAGLNVPALARPTEVRTSIANIAGVNVPVFEDVTFDRPTYSLFATPAWVDRALADLREVNRREAEADVLRQQYDRLHRELVKIVQRVNLFEKVMIPQAREAIRRIRIHLGDEMTAAVGRGKIAKAKISESSGTSPGQNGGLVAALEESPAP